MRGESRLLKGLSQFSLSYFDVSLDYKKILYDNNLLLCTEGRELGPSRKVQLLVSFIIIA